MKFKTQLIMVLLCLFFGLALTACADDPPPPPAPPTAPPVTDPPPAQDPAPDPAPSADVTLTFYGFSEWVGSAPFQAYWQQAVARFEAQNPGFTVELQSDPWGDWEMQYRVMFAVGNPSDIFIVNNPDFPVFANGGHLLNLNNYVPPQVIDQFFPGVQEMYRWQGVDMALAFTTDCRILWFNKEIFEAAGKDPYHPPTTWDELVQFANTIQAETDFHGFGMDLGLREFPAQALFNASTGSILNIAADGSITPNVNTPEFRAYLQTLVDMRGAFTPDFAILNHHEVASLFAAGQLGMIIGNTLVETDIYDNNFRWGQALVPRMDATAPHGSFGGGFGIAVSGQTAHPQQAANFAQILTDPAINGFLHSDLPASEAGLALSPFYGDPNFAVYLQQIQYARQAQPKTLFYAEIDAAVHDIVSEVLVGGLDIDVAITELEARIASIVG